jgi:tRNA-specific adenosine deaminase 3
MAGIVAAAGDARYWDRRSSDWGAMAGNANDPDLEGGPDLHALMRAVAMIASRRADDNSETSPSLPSAPSHIPPLTPLESHFLYASPVAVSCEHDQLALCSRPDSASDPAAESSFERPAAGRIRSHSQGGYLCTGLDIYMTHEPCLSCSMGMLLSRFRAVIIPRRGRMITGGLASEPFPSRAAQSPTAGSLAGTRHSREEEHTGTTSLDPRSREETVGGMPKLAASSATTDLRRNYYGLHWRSELNWRAFGFEFVEEDSTDDEGGEDVAFHA